MQVDYLVLADAAEAVNGKHYILGGGWDRLHAASFPVTHPSMSVALRLRVPWHDTNQAHDLELDVVDEDGQSILPPPGPARGAIRTGRPADLEPGQDQVVPLVFTLAQVRFDRAGAYAVLARLDGLEAARSSFHVIDLQRRGGPR
ncbi:MAG: hypothetical protein IT340_21535 [Chloroflexi bacterium]|nr:hypothetical protein [Chloroflexota bacterium]